MWERADLQQNDFRHYLCFDQRLLSTSYTILDFTSDVCRFYGEKYHVNGVTKLSLGEFSAYCMFDSDYVDLETKNYLTCICKQCSTGSIVSDRDLSDLLLSEQINLNLKKIVTLEIDLTKSASEIWSTYRKSFKSLINKGLRDNDVKIYMGEKIDKKLRLKLRALHLRAAQRRTRSFGKWRAQFSQIENNNAILICVYDGLNIINYSIFSILGNVAYYQTGVNNPDTQAHYGSHVSIHSAVVALKERQIETAILSQHIETDLSLKEISIINFKKGLARIKREYFLFNW